jgi:hypothetical protein
MPPGRLVRDGGELREGGVDDHVGELLRAESGDPMLVADAEKRLLVRIRDSIAELEREAICRPCDKLVDIAAVDFTRADDLILTVPGRRKRQGLAHRERAIRRRCEGVHVEGSARESEIGLEFVRNFRVTRKANDAPSDEIERRSMQERDARVYGSA